MISKERDRELRKIAAKRYASIRPNCEAHKLAAIVKAGKASNRQKERLQHLCEEHLKHKPRIGAVFLSSEEEFERVRLHMMTLAHDNLAAALAKGRDTQAKGANARNEIRDRETRALNERLIEIYAAVHVSNSEMPKSKKIEQAFAREREECSENQSMKGKNRTSPTSFYRAVKQFPGYLEECIKIENSSRKGSWD